MKTLSKEQKEQFSEILESLGQTLDISETQYNAIVSSYNAVGSWLCQPDSLLAPYKPTIIPQGSFMLGLMVQPVHEKDDLDIDLVCQLTGKRPEWTQSHLKSVVGDRLKDHDTYKSMLITPDGRRCWTIRYADTANYHMDILPSIISEGYTILLEKAFSKASTIDYNNLAIRITDKYYFNYRTSVYPEEWLKSNPFGYGKWFFQQASLDLFKSFSLNESIKPVPKFHKNKLPLQRVIQILKRHRDMMFDGHEDKPISIIITTLAARAYQKETDILTALTSIVERITSAIFIEERFDEQRGRYIKWIPNPVNSEENFADKWVDNPQKEANFYSWVGKVRIDVANILKQTGKGIYAIQESMEPFGNRDVTKAFNSYGEQLRLLRENGKQFIAPGTATIASAGIIIPNHKFHGAE